MNTTLRQALRDHTNIVELTEQEEQCKLEQIFEECKKKGIKFEYLTDEAKCLKRFLYNINIGKPFDVIMGCIDYIWKAECEEILPVVFSFQYSFIDPSFIDIAGYIRLSCIRGCLNVFIYLTDEYTNLTNEELNFEQPLLESCKYGRLKIVRYILKKIKIERKMMRLAMKTATVYGKTKVVNYLKTKMYIYC